MRVWPSSHPRRTVAINIHPSQSSGICGRQPTDTDIQILMQAAISGPCQPCLHSVGMATGIRSIAMQSTAFNGFAHLALHATPRL
eukprot:10111694-Karenia_brevis.AAC.1